MDAHIETCVNSCLTCQENQRAPAKAPVHSWEKTEKPWSRLHVDFAGPYQGQFFFLVVDSHSKWLEVLRVPSMTASCTIRGLRALFATHGLPHTIVSDNGGTFISEEFKDFLRKNQIRQVFVAPYHPSSNGQAERMVATTKQSLKKIIQGDWSTRLARFLFSQHTLPSTTTGKSPAELLMNRRLCSLLDRLHPDLNNVTKNQPIDGKRARSFEQGDPVYVRDYRSGGPAWTPARVVESTGPVSYRAELADGEIQRRHVDQIRKRLEPELSTPAEDTTNPTTSVDSPVSSLPVPEIANDCVEPVPEIPELPQVRRSQRVTRRPAYLGDYV